MLKTNTLESGCRFCFLDSKTDGQDPIGSAGTFHQWLIKDGLSRSRCGQDVILRP